MFNKLLLRNTFIAIGILAFLSAVYFYPALSGKSMSQNDVVQSLGASKEAKDFKASSGEEILWTNSMFSGMPIWDGFKATALIHPHKFFTKYIPVPILLIFIAAISFYALMRAYDADVWLSTAGGLAFAFASFNIISLEAGHINKVFAIIFMPLILAGIVRVYRGKYISGMILTIVGTTFQVFYFHVQITYYLLILMLFLLISIVIEKVKTGELKSFFKESIILAVCAVIAILPNMGRMATMQEYAKSTPRGGSELTTKQKDKGGLDYDYAFQWSNGLSEPVTILIPGFYGGSSSENIGKSSEFYKTLTQTDYADQALDIAKEAPLYWGDQPFTSGPVYFGAIICFFFVLGMILLKGPWKWTLLAASILSILLSYGKNLPFINDFFFYHVPLYNKFRSVTMILTIAQLVFPLVGLVALKKIYDNEFSKEEIYKALKYSVFGLGGFIIIFGIFGSWTMDFISPSDEKMPEIFSAALMKDRAKQLRFDSFRSLFFILAGAGLVWALINEKLTTTAVSFILMATVVLDLWTVDKKYLNKDNFKSIKNLEETVFTPTQADLRIQQDTTKYFRVFNTDNSFNDAITSYRHKSIGGYSAIKLGRYQDIIDSCLYKNNFQVICMLNARYVLGRDKQSGVPIAQPNPDALGNAWFVPTITVVKNADEELSGLGANTFNPRLTVLIDKRFESQVKGFTPQLDSNASIRLTVYHPNHLTYSSQAATDQLAVFSEIYFSPGWQAYLDDKPVEHFRCNYTLRGMKIPAGKHKVEFRFEPEYYIRGEKISGVGSIILIVSLLGLIGYGFYSSRKKE